MDISAFFLFHKAAGVLGTTCMLTGVGAVLFFRKHRNWLKVHKLFNLAAVIFLFTGISLVFILVQKQQGEHFSGFHPVAGMATLVLAFSSLVLGFYQLKAENKIRARRIHRLLGRLASLSMIVALISGAVHAGII